jgi:parvulin-like peptidyl-prolyl isomerase
MSPPEPSRRALWLLTAGAVLGLVLAMAGLLGSREPGLTLPGSAVARVNDAVIRRDDYQRLLAGVERDTKEPVTDAVRTRVLDRLIEEELLVQRALELGLARADRRVRADLVSAMITSVTANAEEREPDADELRDFYAEERDFFTQPGRLRVRQIFFRVRDFSQDAEAAARAARASEKLRAGEAFAEVVRALGDEEVAPLPQALLPPQKLLEYLGPTALRAALALGPGDVSDPVRSGTGYHVLQLVESEPSRVADFDEIEALVRVEWTRRTGERALREYLDDLRARAEIVQ